METPATGRNSTNGSQAVTPLISVVVPFYNVEECVTDCMDSLIDQDFESYEVVCVDDGSTDGTGGLLDSYAERDPHVRVFHFRNAGLSVARNRGVELAEAELITFVDGDDFVSPYYLSALYRAHGDIAGRLVQARRVTGTRDNLKGLEWPAAASAPQTELLSGDGLRHAYLMGRLPDAAWARLAHRSLYEDVPFTPGMVFEDRMCMPDVIEHVNEIAMLDQVIYAYVVRTGSITKPQAITQKDAEDQLRAIRHVAEVVSSWDDESQRLVPWRMTAMSSYAISLSSNIPNREVANRCVRESTLIICRNLLQALNVRRRYSLSWKPMALCLIALTCPKTYGALRNLKHLVNALTKRLTIQ